MFFCWRHCNTTHSSQTPRLWSSSSITLLSSLAAANLLSEAATMQRCLFWDFTVIVPAAVYAFAVVNPLNMYFPCKCF